MDREKVIKGLECCIRHGENAEVGCGRKDECPYEQNGLKCWLDLNRDALALLKEQEERINKMLHQPRSVICCYRCKWNSGTQDKPYCQKYTMARLPEWFCADGERKEGR